MPTRRSGTRRSGTRRSGTRRSGTRSRRSSIKRRSVRLRYRGDGVRRYRSARRTDVPSLQFNGKTFRVEIITRPENEAAMRVALDPQNHCKSLKKGTGEQPDLQFADSASEYVVLRDDSDDTCVMLMHQWDAISKRVSEHPKCWIHLDRFLRETRTLSLESLDWRTYSDDAFEQFATPISAKIASDWFPLPPGKASDYRVEILDDGTIAYNFTQKKDPIEKRTFSFVATPNGEIYAFHYTDREMLMCSERAIRERKERMQRAGALSQDEATYMDSLKGESCGSYNDPACCFYHGKLANKLLDEGLLSPNEGLIAAGEFVVDDNLRIIKVTNQSGHFQPPGFSNDNFLRLISFYIKVKIQVENNKWGHGSVIQDVESRIA